MTASKIVAAAASGVSRDPGPDIDDLFATHVYDGNNTTRFITNNVALGSTYQFDHTFDGTQTTPNTISPGLGTINTWEVSFFLKCTDTSVGNQWVIATNQGYSNSSPAGFLIGLYNLPGYLSIAIAGTNFGAYGFTGDYEILQDRTYHVVVNYNGNGQCRVFVDGFAIGASNGSLSLGSGFVTWSTVDLGIGRSTQGGAYNTPFKGSLHDVTVSSTVSKTSNFQAPTMQSSGATEDVAGKGGLIWTKSRSHALNNAIVDTVQGRGKYLVTNSASATRTDSYAQETILDFLNDGYKLGKDTGSDVMNRSGRQYVSWTFAKQEKFMDIQTWTGNGSARTISHNLGSVPGIIIVKRTSNTEDWNMFHRSLGNTKYMQINGTGQAGTSGTSGGQANLWNNTDPTSTEFTVGTHDRVNTNGETYIAYLFAHNDGDGVFGENANQDVIKCGNYTGNATAQNFVNLGFEPQFLLIKKTTSTSNSNWWILDNIRGMAVQGDDELGYANSFDAHFVSNQVDLRGNGFALTSTGDSFNGNGDNYIYLAIRRGPLAVPTDVSKVFKTSMGLNASAEGNTWNTPFPIDLHIYKNLSTSHHYFFDRIRGNSKMIRSDLTNNEVGQSYNNELDHMDGMHSTNAYDYTGWIGYSWKRAPSYLDIVGYIGNNSARTINHNLNKVPEMIWVKQRDGTRPWIVYHSATGNDRFTILNATDAQTSSGETVWNQTTPTDSVFSLGNQNAVNENGYDFIAYLFATADGVSKVGTYEGNGTDGKQIDCGFSNGARYVLIKNVDTGSTNWLLFDTVRGINAGNDSLFYLNTSAGPATGTDYIDPYSSGFAVTANAQINNSGDTYIFYAIAA